MKSLNLLSGILRRIFLTHAPESFHHRSLLRNINIPVKGGKCYQLFTKVPQLHGRRAPFADEDPICTRRKDFSGQRSKISLHQWCTTSGPRATSGPRRVVKWPAMSTRKATISDLTLTLYRQECTPIISQHLDEL